MVLHAMHGNQIFFKFIIKLVGVYICFDNNTKSQSKMDISRILVRTKCSMVLNEILSEKIIGIIYRLKIIKDSHNYIRICMMDESTKSEFSKSSDSDSDTCFEDSEDHFSMDGINFGMEADPMVEEEALEVLKPMEFWAKCNYDIFIGNDDSEKMTLDLLGSEAKESLLNNMV